MSICERSCFVHEFFKQGTKAHMVFFFIQIIDERVSYEADICRAHLGLKTIAGIFPQRSAIP